MYHLMSWSLLHRFTFSFRIFFILLSPIFHILMFRNSNEFLFAMPVQIPINFLLSTASSVAQFPFYCCFIDSLQSLYIHANSVYSQIRMSLFRLKWPLISYINRYRMDTHCTTSSTSNYSIYIWVILINSITFFVIITAVVVYLAFVDFPKFLLYTSKSSSNSLKDFI